MIDDLLSYLRSLRITQGQGEGERLVVLPWQEDFVRGVFDEAVTVAACSTARANGKSTWCGALAAAFVDPDSPLHRPRATTAVFAGSLNQARIIFRHAGAFLEQRHGEIKRPVWKNVDNPNYVAIEHLPTGSEVRAFAADPRRAHGLAGSVIADEPAQWLPSKRDALWAALSTGPATKIPGAKVIVVGTRAATPDHFFEQLLYEGDADWSRVYSAPRDCDPQDEDMMVMANPSWDRFPLLRRAVRREAAKAARSAEVLPRYRSLRLNSGVADVPERELVSAIAWRSCIEDAENEPPRSWGVDLSEGVSMACVACYSVHTGFLDVLGAVSAQPDLAERGRRDNVGDLYQRMHAAGELVVHDGATVKVDQLFHQAHERFGAPTWIAADHYKRRQCIDGLAESGVPVVPVEFRKPSWGDAADDVGRFRRAVLDKRVKSTRNLMLASAVGEARIVTNSSSLERLAKGSVGGRRQHGRDDAVDAAIKAVAIAERNRSRFTKPKRRRVVVAG